MNALAVTEEGNKKALVLKFEICVFVEKDENGYIAYCPELKGLLADGDTEKEVLNNFAECAIAYIKSLIKHNDPLPLCSTIQLKDVPEKVKKVDLPLSVKINGCYVC